MSYNRRRHEALRRLGIEQLPTLRIATLSHDDHLAHGVGLPVRTMPVSYKRSCTIARLSTDNALTRCLAASAQTAPHEVRRAGSSQERSVRNAAHKSTEFCLAHEHAIKFAQVRKSRCWGCRCMGPAMSVAGREEWAKGRNFGAATARRQKFERS